MSGPNLGGAHVFPLPAQIGDRVRFLGFGEHDPYSRLKPGTLGTVELTDSVGTVHVAWDDGGRLGLIAGVDRFQIVAREGGEYE